MKFSISVSLFTRRRPSRRRNRFGGLPGKELTTAAAAASLTVGVATAPELCWEPGCTTTDATPSPVYEYHVTPEGNLAVVEVPDAPKAIRLARAPGVVSDAAPVDLRKLLKAPTGPSVGPSQAAAQAAEKAAAGRSLLGRAFRWAGRLGWVALTSLSGDTPRASEPTADTVYSDWFRVDGNPTLVRIKVGGNERVTLEYGEEFGELIRLGSEPPPAFHGTFRLTGEEEWTAFTDDGTPFATYSAEDGFRPVWSALPEGLAARGHARDRATGFVTEPLPTLGDTPRLEARTGGGFVVRGSSLDGASLAPLSASEGKARFVRNGADAAPEGAQFFQIKLPRLESEGKPFNLVAALHDGKLQVALPPFKSVASEDVRALHALARVMPASEGIRSIQLTSGGNDFGPEVALPSGSVWDAESHPPPLFVENPMPAPHELDWVEDESGDLVLRNIADPTDSTTYAILHRGALSAAQRRPRIGFFLPKVTDSPTGVLVAVDDQPLLTLPAGTSSEDAIAATRAILDSDSPLDVYRQRYAQLAAKAGVPDIQGWRRVERPGAPPGTVTFYDAEGALVHVTRGADGVFDVRAGDARVARDFMAQFRVGSGVPDPRVRVSLSRGSVSDQHRLHQLLTSDGWVALGDGRGGVLFSAAVPSLARKVGRFFDTFPDKRDAFVNLVQSETELGQYFRRLGFSVNAEGGLVIPERNAVRGVLKEMGFDWDWRLVARSSEEGTVKTVSLADGFTAARTVPGMSEVHDREFLRTWIDRTVLDASRDWQAALDPTVAPNDAVDFDLHNLVHIFHYLRYPEKMAQLDALITAALAVPPIDFQARWQPSIRHLMEYSMFVPADATPLHTVVPFVAEHTGNIITVRDAERGLEGADADTFTALATRLVREREDLVDLFGAVSIDPTFPGRRAAILTLEEHLRIGASPEEIRFWTLATIVQIHNWGLLPADKFVSSFYPDSPLHPLLQRIARGSLSPADALNGSR